MKQLKSEIMEELDNITNQTKDLCFRLAKAGVQLAKLEILSFDDPPFDTGELYDSISLKKGDMITDGNNHYYIYTDCEYAKYVELGTGPIGAGSNAMASKIGWKYGNKGWYYYNDRLGTVIYTEGMEARPFMSKTATRLNSLVAGIAKEVFR